MTQSYWSRAIALFLIGLAASGSNAFAAGFPAEYVGRWGQGPEGCSPGAVHGGLTIERGSVMDGEFSGAVRKVAIQLDGSINVTEQWDVPDEGVTSLVANYRLSKNRKSLTVRYDAPEPGGEAQTQNLIRCEARR